MAAAKQQHYYLHVLPLNLQTIPFGPRHHDTNVRKEDVFRRVNVTFPRVEHYARHKWLDLFLRQFAASQKLKSWIGFPRLPSGNDCQDSANPTIQLSQVEQHIVNLI